MDSRLGRSRHRRWVWAGVIVSILAAGTAARGEQQLMVGSVSLKLGVSDDVVKQLAKQHNVRPIEGGWSVQPLVRGGAEPGIGVRTKNGQIEEVSFVWGPGATPRAEELARQLGQALPVQGQCEISNSAHSQEGGTVHRLTWRCTGYSITLVTGLWREGNTVSISIEKN